LKGRVKKGDSIENKERAGSRAAEHRLKGILGWRKESKQYSLGTETEAHLKP